MKGKLLSKSISPCKKKKKKKNGQPDENPS